jgi:hypothetical protein
LIDAHAAITGGTAMANDRTRPTVALISPQKGTFVDRLVSVEVAAADNVGVVRVDLHVDGAVYASTVVGPYAFAWDTAGLEPGMHSLRAYAYDAAGHYGRTSVIKVYVTPGEGLLVQSAKIDPGSGAADGKMRLKAMLRLPQGVEFDGTTDGVSVSLEGSGGAVLAMEVSPGTMEMRQATAKYRGLTVSPAGGDVQLVIKPNRVGGTYSLQLTGRLLRLSDAATPMDLSIVVDGHTVSQPLSLRPSRGDLVVP